MLFCYVYSAVDQGKLSLFKIAVVKNHDARLRDSIRNDAVAIAGKPLPCASDDANLVAIIPNAVAVTMRTANHGRHREPHPCAGMADIAKVDAVRRCLKVAARSRGNVVGEIVLACLEIEIVGLGTRCSSYPH